MLLLLLLREVLAYKLAVLIGVVDEEGVVDRARPVEDALNEPLERQHAILGVAFSHELGIFAGGITPAGAQLNDLRVILFFCVACRPGCFVSLVEICKGKACGFAASFEPGIPLPTFFVWPPAVVSVV